MSSGPFKALAPCGQTTPSLAKNAASFVELPSSWASQKADRSATIAEVVSAEVVSAELVWSVAQAPAANKPATSTRDFGESKSERDMGHIRDGVSPRSRRTLGP